MKTTLYSLKDISEITGKAENKINEAIDNMKLSPTVTYSYNQVAKEKFTEEQLSLIKYYLRDYHSKNPISIPLTSLDFITADNDILMASSKTIDNTWYIFRNTNEEVEIFLTQNKDILSTHFLFPKECKHIKEFFPQINLKEYKIKNKSYL